MSTSRILAILIILFALTVSTSGQNAETTPEYLQMYASGDYAGAQAVLMELTRTNEGEKNALNWNYLGLCYYQLNETKSAIKSFKKAVKLDPGNSVVRFNYAFVLRELKDKNALNEAEAVLRLVPDGADSNYIVGHVNLDNGNYEMALKYSNRSLEIDPRHFSAMMVKASSLLLMGLAAPGELPGDADLAEILGICKTYAQIVPSKNYDRMMSAVCYHTNNFYEWKEYKERDQITEFKVLSKPRAPFTDAARNKGLTGKVILLAGFDKSGQVIHPLLLKPLGYGLDETSIRAALSIKFTPERVDGEPISVSKRIEYMYSTYERR